MTRAFVHKVPQISVEAGVLVVDFESGESTLSVALTRHAALGLLKGLPKSFEMLEKGAVVHEMESPGFAASD